jgi:hypothetical protein
MYNEQLRNRFKQKGRRDARSVLDKRGISSSLKQRIGNFLWMVQEVGTLISAVLH